MLRKPRFLGSSTAVSDWRSGMGPRQLFNQPGLWVNILRERAAPPSPPLSLVMVGRSDTFMLSFPCLLLWGCWIENKRKEAKAISCWPFVGPLLCLSQCLLLHGRLLWVSNTLSTAGSSVCLLTFVQSVLLAWSICVFCLVNYKTPFESHALCEAFLPHPGRIKPLLIQWPIKLLHTSASWHWEVDVCAIACNLFKIHFHRWCDRNVHYVEINSGPRAHSASVPFKGSLKKCLAGISKTL